jgi:hypothetical protein
VRRRRRVLHGALVVLALATACGDNVQPGAPDATIGPDATMPIGTAGTPPGTYPFTVTATVDGLQASAPFTLVVQ